MLSVAALVLILASHGATAGSIAIGPEGLAHPEDGEHYYVWIVPGPIERPGVADPSDDCGEGEGALANEAQTLADDLASWDPMSDFGGGTWFPTCVSGSPAPCGAMGTCPPTPALADAYVAYDVTTGRYYLELEPAMVPGLAFPEGASIALTGTTGAGLLLDCVGCPPPTCCDD